MICDDCEKKLWMYISKRNNNCICINVFECDKKNKCDIEEFIYSINEILRIAKQRDYKSLTLSR
jgi:hypothetical protein